MMAGKSTDQELAKLVRKQTVTIRDLMRVNHRQAEEIVPPHRRVLSCRPGRPGAGHLTRCRESARPVASGAGSSIGGDNYFRSLENPPPSHRTTGPSATCDRR